MQHCNLITDRAGSTSCTLTWRGLPDVRMFSLRMFGSVARMVAFSGIQWHVWWLVFQWHVWWRLRRAGRDVCVPYFLSCACLVRWHVWRIGGACFCFEELDAQRAACSPDLRLPSCTLSHCVHVVYGMQYFSWHQSTTCASCCPLMSLYLPPNQWRACGRGWELHCAITGKPQGAAAHFTSSRPAIPLTCL